MPVKKHRLAAKQLERSERHQSVPSSYRIGSTTAGSVILGAAVGSAFGPLGTWLGASVGGTVGLVVSTGVLEGRRRE